MQAGTICAVKQDPHAQSPERHLCISVQLQTTLAGAEVKAAWHVGDTPYDIKASQVGGAGAIGVLTGVHTLQDLDKAATGVGECPACLFHFLRLFAS